MKIFLAFILIPTIVLANSYTSICNTPKLMDSYTLSLTWLPSACRISEEKYPECIEAGNNYKFFLHGLWPEKRECGIYYQFCDKISYQEDRTLYPSIGITVNNLKELAEVMPNVKYNGHLEKHEWWKHGTCSPFDASKYFQISINLTNQINNSNFVKEYISKNVGKHLELQDLYQNFDKSFGNNAHKSLELICKEGYLQEIKVHLPVHIELGLSNISNIIGELGSDNGGSCSGDIILLK